jgi:hypothetical protein
MAEQEVLKFDYKEVATALIKQQGLHEGFWAVYMEFAIGAANIMGMEGKLLPTAVVPVISMGLRRVENLDDLSVDAAQVNGAVASQPVAKVKPARKKPATRKST